jgi:uncharacterized protein
MKALFHVSPLVLGIVALAAMFVSPQRGAAAGKVRVLVTVGGHDYEEKPFDAMFAGMPDLQVTKAVLPKEIDLLKPGLEKKYDVLVRYDMVGNLSTEHKKAFVDLMQSGIGLVSLHHNLCVQGGWPEYFNIIGTTTNKTYKEGLDMRVLVVDKEHPITRGVKDFVIHDEAYNGYRIAPEAHVLLRTNHPKNSPAEIAWTTKYGRSHVVYLMLGHDGKAYGNPAYRTLVQNAILWTATMNRQQNAAKPLPKDSQ